MERPVYTAEKLRELEARMVAPYLEYMLNEFLGRYVVVRDDRIGVYFGKLEAINYLHGQKAWVMTHARQAHYWTRAAATPGLGMTGPGHAPDERIGPPVTIHGVSGDGLILCTDQSVRQFMTAPVWHDEELPPEDLPQPPTLVQVPRRIGEDT